MKNVGIIAVCDFDKNPLGGEVFLLKNLLKEKCDEDLNIFLIGMSFDKNDVVGKWNKKIINGIEYDYLPITKVLKEKEKSKIPFRLRLVLGTIKYYKRICKKNLNSIYIHSAELIIPFLHEKAMNIIYHVHGDPRGTLKISRFPIFRGDLISKVYNKLIDLSMRKSDLIIWAADRSKNLYLENRNRSYCKYIDDKSVTIHSSFDNALTARDYKGSFKLDSNKRYLITVGRLSKVKRIDFIIESFYHLSKVYDDMVLIICGEGEEKTELFNKVKSLKISDKVMFVGNANREELAYFLSNSEVFLFASENEALSLVVLESLFMGTPVVTTDVGDVPIVVKCGVTGEVVYKYDEEEFNNAIIKILNLGKQFYKKNCMDTANEFSPRNMATKIYYNINKF